MIPFLKVYRMLGELRVLRVCRASEERQMMKEYSIGFGNHQVWKLDSLMEIDVLVTGNSSFSQDSFQSRLFINSILGVRSQLLEHFRIILGVTTLKFKSCEEHTVRWFVLILEEVLHIRSPPRHRCWPLRVS